MGVMNLTLVRSSSLPCAADPDPADGGWGGCHPAVGVRRGLALPPPCGWGDFGPGEPRWP